MPHDDHRIASQGKGGPSGDGGADARYVRPDPTDFRDCVYEPRLTDVALRMMPPAGISIRVRDQGENDPSCTGQALAALIDIQRANRLRVNGTAGSESLEPVSARMLFEMAKAYDGFDDGAFLGSSLRGALKGFYHNGVCSEKLAPFISGEPFWALTVDMAKNARNCGLGAYFRLRHVLYDYHAALSEVGGVLCSALIHPGWDLAELEKNRGHIVSPPPSVGTRVGHAFVLVGYDDTGFYVLNSQGGKWGGVEDADGKPRLGIAHWSYEDWARHVIDAWVLRLEVPAPELFHLTGGLDTRTRKWGARVTTPRIHISGHYVNLKGGRFVLKGTYPSDEAYIKETGRFLENSKADKPIDYKEFLIVVDSGLESLERSVERAALLTPLFKGNGIYPIFVFWHNDLLERIAALLDHQAAGLTAKYGTAGAELDRALERFGNDQACSLWGGVYEDATRSAFKGRAPRATDEFLLPKEGAGDAWNAWTALTGSALLNKAGLRIHLAAHSFGTVLLGQLLLRARLERTSLSGLASLSLFAPACSIGFFRHRFSGARSALKAGGSKGRLNVYTLTEDREAMDRTGSYGGSLLRYLAATTKASDPPFGLATAGSGRLGRSIRRIVAGTPNLAPELRTHKDFLDDEAVLRDFIGRLLSRR
ncbi:C1 family peptidase (plasmid) [Azospirillum sp. A26]|uniref:hypothetical protein n=1 Tax=Azospirillum sp. A26 TaxID=3160607 RepID=UPI003671A459